MADYGFKVSQPGFDVKTATNLQLGFSSAFNSFKVSASGSGSTGSMAANTITTFQVAHGLSYAPAFMAWLQDSLSNWIPYSSGGFAGGDYATGVFASVYSDTTNLYLKIYNNDNVNAHTYSYYYLIFLDPAQ